MIIAATGLSSVPAAAASYLFTYGIDNVAVSGSLAGSLASDQNTFNITGVNFLNVNGSPVPGTPAVQGTDTYIFGTGSSPVATLDKSVLDFAVFSGNNQALFFGVGDRLQTTYGFPSAYLSKGYGGGGGVNRFNSTSFSASVSDVPEPATWAMFIGGFGLIGATMRRRQRVSVTFA